MYLSKSTWPGCAVRPLVCLLMIGSDLHAYRGHEEGRGYVMGHEVVGTIVETGRAVNKFAVGDVVIAPFSVSCGRCSLRDLLIKAHAFTAIRGIRPAVSRMHASQADKQSISACHSPMAACSLFQAEENYPRT